MTRRPTWLIGTARTSNDKRSLAVELTADDLRRIDTAASNIKVEGTRYSERLEKMIRL